MNKTAVVLKNLKSTKVVRKSSSVKKRYFDEYVPVRMSKDMVEMIDFIIKHPKSTFEGKPLFDNRSHFVKASVIKHLRELKEKYESI